jgi:hypothetical protein
LTFRDSRYTLRLVLTYLGRFTMAVKKKAAAKPAAAKKAPAKKAAPKKKK